MARSFPRAASAKPNFYQASFPLAGQKGIPMILDRTKTIFVRWWTTVIACSAFAARAMAQPTLPAEIDGVYNGSYAGDKGPTKLKLTLTTQQDGTLVGVFTLYLPEGSKKHLGSHLNN